MTGLFYLIRDNGRWHYKDIQDIKLVVQMNMVWGATYLNLIICNIIIGFIEVNLPSGYYIFTATCHLFFWIVFLLTRWNRFKIARHILLLLAYSMIAGYDHILGKGAFMCIYFIAFLPTAFKFFSFNTHRITAIIYTLLILVILLVSNLYTYTLVSPIELSIEKVAKLRTMNIVMSFLLAFTYAVYNVVFGNLRQMKLMKQSIRLQTTLNNAIGGIWSIDNNYLITSANQAFIDFVRKQHNPEEIKIGFNMKLILDKPDVPQQIKEAYVRVLRGEVVYEELVYKNRTFEIKAVPIYDNDKVIIGATFASRDITNKKEANEVLVRAMKAAEEAAKAKARFLSNMSHEIRTPLNGIVGITNILMDEKHLPSQEKSFETLGNLSEHTLQLVNNILDLAKLEAGKSEVNITRFNLQLFVNRQYSIFEQTARIRKLNFSIVIEGDADIYLKSDEIKLSQVIINLLSNAMKFTEKGFVKLTVSVPPVDEMGIHKVRFSVIDSGIGINKANQRKIFESFTQADSMTTRKFDGTGLGITISDKILTLLNAKLSVESDLGKGSVFWFELPMEASSFIPDKEIPVKKMGDFDLSGVELLVAEDNQVNQMVIRRILEKWKATVQIVENGQEALKEVAGRNYHIILMDLDMPVMDGYEATAALKIIKPHLPVIALTAAAFDDMENYLLRKGFSGVMQKPFKSDDLYSKIMKLLQKAPA